MQFQILYFFVMMLSTSHLRCLPKSCVTAFDETTLLLWNSKWRYSFVFSSAYLRLFVMAFPTSRRPWLLTRCRRYWPSAPRVGLSDCILSVAVQTGIGHGSFGSEHPCEAAAGKWTSVWADIDEGWCTLVGFYGACRMAVHLCLHLWEIAIQAKDCENCNL